MDSSSAGDLFNGSDDDVVLIGEDEPLPIRRAVRGRRASTVWREILPVNPGPDGTHTTCRCRHCLAVFNHPVKRRASRMLIHLSKCPAYRRFLNGVSSHSVLVRIHLSKSPSPNEFIQAGTIAKPPSSKKSKIELCHQHLAQWFYETGTSFHHVENEHLLEAFRVFFPKIVLPSREELAGSLLKNAYD